MFQKGRVSVCESCPECGRVFRRHCNLRNHMRVHNKQGTKISAVDTTVTNENIDFGGSDDFNLDADITGNMRNFNYSL